MQIIVSESFSPSFNLASEQFLLTERPCDVLFFYINDPCVVLGRNQNIYAEVNLSYCRSENIRVVRRLSGGGTVYHDRGNINFCFIAPKASNPLDYNPLSNIVAALSEFDIHTTVGSRKDLYLNQKKITGTAVHSSGTHVLFHGTLLYDTDLDALETALTSMHATESKAVKSVRSKVTNIRTETAALTTTDTSDFLHLLADYFAKQHGTRVTCFSSQENEVVEKLQSERYESWEWSWAQSPKCELEYRYDGQTPLLLTIEQGLVSVIANDCPAELRSRLLGRKFSDLL
jgi:lipoate-protein ligase A